MSSDGKVTFEKSVQGVRRLKQLRKEFLSMKAFGKKKGPTLDPDGQPYAPINAHQNFCKSIDYLTGLCEGVIADHVLVPDEINCLANWLGRCSDLLDKWPANIIAPKSGPDSRRWRNNKSRSLNFPVKQNELFSNLIGLRASGLAGENHCRRSRVWSCSRHGFPLMRFCVSMESENSAKRSRATAGGKIVKDVTRQLNYLVIGSVASRDWAHANFGKED